MAYIFRKNYGHYLEMCFIMQRSFLGRDGSVRGFFCEDAEKWLPSCPVIA